MNPLRNPIGTGGAVRRWARAGIAALLTTAGAAAVRAGDAWTFEQALRFASTNSPDARIAAQRIASAEASMRQADAAWWPTVRAGASYGYTDNPMRAFGAILNQRQFSPTLDFNDVPGADNLNVRGGVVVPLYSGGRTPAAREAAQAGGRAARHGEQATQATLSWEVARTFHTVQKARSLVRATESAVVSFTTNAALARKRFDAGTLLKSEVLDVEVRLAQAREDLVRARNAASLATRAMRSLLGLETGEFEVSDAIPEIDEPSGGTPLERPELRAAEEGERAADARVREARAGYRPRLNAFAEAAYDHGWRFNGGGDSYAAGAAIEWDVWDGQLTRGKVSEARAGLEVSREQSRKLRLALDFEAEQARLALADAGERLTVTAQMVDQAAESAQLTRDRFDQGLALASQLIDAETALTAARMRRAEAEADRRIAVAALRRALGQPQLPGRPSATP